jgi:hypothetical protein
MLLAILQHVNQGVAHLARGFEGHAVPAIRPETAAPKEQPIHAPRQAYHQTAHARRESRCAVRLDDEVQVILLYRIVRDAKLRAVARSQC